MPRHQLFNRRRHRLLRPSVPRTETLASVLVGCGLLGMVAWVLGQRDAYDPGMRDLAPELLSRDGPKIALYNPPLKLWVAPGTASPGDPPGLDVAPFPAAILDAHWTLAGRVRAFDASNLYEKINGEAEKFIKQGFESLHYAVLRRDDGTELAVELYDQGGLGGSLGIFSAHRPGDRDVLERAGVSFFTTSVGVIGRIGQYFFRAAADRAGPEVSAKALALVDALGALAAPGRAAAQTAAPAGTSERPTAVAGLDSQGRATEPQRAKPQAQPVPARPVPMQLLMAALQAGETSIAFEKRNVFQFDFANDFWFARLDGDARAFVHEAGSSADATALLSALLAEQSYDYATVRADADGALLRHQFLNTFFAIARAGRFLIGTENAGDQSLADAILARLRRAADDETR